METQRRWIASIVEGAIGAALSIMVVALITILVVFQSVQESGIEFSIQNLLKLLLSVGGLYSLNFCCIALPMFVITTLGAYHQHKVTGDYLIDRFWKNPKIKDR